MSGPFASIFERPWAWFADMGDKVMEEFRDEILDALQAAGYDLCTALEYWNQFRKEIHTMKPGKHTIMVGKTEFKFKIEHRKVK